MSAPNPTPQSVQVLRDFLRADAPARERSAAKWMSIVGGACLVISLALGPVIGWKLALGLAGLLGAVVGYYLAVLSALGRGWYHPAIAWANVLLETSIPLAVLLVDNQAKGPLYALNAPPVMVWGVLIMFSALRASRSLAVAAGALGAVEYLLAYALVLHPQLGEPPVFVSPAFVAIRAFFLFAAGAAGAILTRHFLNKAEQALHAVRAADLLSKYFLHEKLGAGGMAEVFRATYSPEGGFEKTVAIKRVLPDYSADPAFTELFKREAQICSLLAHPNIVQVFDIGKFEGRYILAMEFVEGLSLYRLLKARKGEPLPLPAVSYLGAELASALDYLHRRTDSAGAPLGLVHRDVNPPNVLVSRIGEVKLSDFGVAHAAKSPSRSGIIVGKPGYLAPEQARCEAIDGRADLFCLGLTLHEALTGLRLQRGSSTVEVVQAAFAEVMPPSALNPDVPPELDRVVMDLLAADPGRRPANGREVRARLTALEGAAAPYPAGQAALVRCVEEVMVLPGGAGEPTPAPDLVTLASQSTPGQKQAG